MHVPKRTCRNARADRAPLAITWPWAIAKISYYLLKSIVQLRSARTSDIFCIAVEEAHCFLLEISDHCTHTSHVVNWWLISALATCYGDWFTCGYVWNVLAGWFSVNPLLTLAVFLLLPWRNRKIECTNLVSRFGWQHKRRWVYIILLNKER